MQYLISTKREKQSGKRCGYNNQKTGEKTEQNIQNVGKGGKRCLHNKAYERGEIRLPSVENAMELGRGERKNCENVNSRP